VFLDVCTYVYFVGCVFLAYDVIKDVICVCIEFMKLQYDAVCRYSTCVLNLTRSLLTVRHQNGKKLMRNETKQVVDNLK